jgi:hypothetical protein
MQRYRTQGLLAVGLGLMVGGCFGDTALNTDLRPAGDPEVLAGLARSEIDGTEAPFFCRYKGSTLDPKGPNIVQGAEICPMDSTMFEANEVDPRVSTELGISWGVRFMFDELLNGDAVEDLACDTDGLCTGSLKSNVLSLTCGASNTHVGITGWYAPNGNNTTFPLGPSLKLNPVPEEMVFPTGTMCNVTLGDAIVDKSGNKVPTDQRSYPVKIADLALITIDTGINGASTANLAGNATNVFAFNASLDDDSVDGTDFDFAAPDGTSVVGTTQAHGAATPVAVGFRFDDDWNLDVDPDVVELNDGAYFRASPYLTPGSYIARLKVGAEIKEMNGGSHIATADDMTEKFTVAYGFVSSVPASGAGVPSGNTPPTIPAASASADLQIRLNGEIVPSTVEMTDVVLKDAAGATVPFTMSIGTGANNDRIIINPTADLTPGMTYTLSIPAATKIDWAGTCAADASPACKTATFAAARNITFRVQ